jgi:prevent-host-death family protein
VREVTLRELNRHTSRVVTATCAGERMIITRHGMPVAVLMSTLDALELAGLPEPELRGRFAQSPTPMALRDSLWEGLRRLVGSEMERRMRRRAWSRLLRGRVMGGGDA